MDENMEAVSNEAMDADIDAEWGGEGAPETPTQSESAPAPEGKDPVEPKNEPPAAEKGDAGQDQPELFTLKNRNEARQVTREQLIAMAQKGLDYDTVCQERDQLRQYRQEADPALKLVKAYAQQNGMGVGDYLDFCRKQELMKQGMTERDAQTSLEMEKKDAELTERENAVKIQENAQTSAAARAKEEAAKRQRDIQAFCKAYPGVGSKSIPKEVWQAVADGNTLMNAYTMHENKRLRAELESLQNELAAERQNKDNQARSPGSLGSNSGAEPDEIDRLWAEDD